MVNVILELGPMHELRSIKANGHANADGYGKDIVCSAVSSLLRTVVLTLFDEEKKLRTTVNVQNSGELFFEVVYFTSENLPRLQYAADFLQKGMESIELERPESIHFTVNCVYA